MDAKTPAVVKKFPVQDDGFTLVCSRRRKKRINKLCDLLAKHGGPEVLAIDREEKSLSFKKDTLWDIQNEVESSEYFKAFRENLVTVLKHINSSRTSSEDTLTEFDTKDPSINVDYTVDVICYGLGNFASSVMSRYQLGFLLALKGTLGTTGCTQVYDPIFSKQEVAFLEEVGLDVLEVDEEAKRTVKRTTIFFMPHCDLHLYNNLFSANWNPKSLQNLILIGNCLENYKLHLCGDRYRQQAKYAYYVTGFETEIAITNSFYLTDIFNDMSIHYFRLNDLPSAENDLWNDLGD
ncbi:SRR1-like protein [Uloborus diversus]|uniref:SRR1-like protein n=1 Tax=Uloborus diversus TaxID=327109 RepID=UPI0024096192|nr:SRR1-like protein [Uloborus diversus]XP_054714687.1 SRR1-like protein [Uloborus diversus]